MAAGLFLTQKHIDQSSYDAWLRTQRLLAGWPTADDLAKAPQLLPLALRRMLVDGRADQAIATLRRQPTSLRARAVTFEVAAYLETGDLHRARTLWQGTPDRIDATPFRQRVRRGFSAMQSGVKAALFDRTGVPIAYRAGDDRIGLSPTVDPRLLPQPALAVLPEIGGARLTLDLALSQNLLEAFHGRTSRRVQGGLVVLDANDASLLAAVSTRSSKGSLAHDFLRSVREPASIAKLITASATLRAGLNPDAEIRRKRCTGGVLLGGRPLYCSSIGGRLSGLDEAMATSCNVAFAVLGQRVGASALIDEYRRFGFAEDSQRQHPLYGNLLENHPGPYQLGEMAIGLNLVQITPLHAAVLARTMVDGYLRTPHLLIARDGLLGLSPRPEDIDQTNRALLGQMPAPLAYLDQSTPILLPEWLPRLHSAMSAVADPGGTAFGVEPRGFEVAMKTGTASDPATGFHVNYIGYAPRQNPRFAFALRLTHGRTSKRIRRQARAITHQILQILADYDEPPANSLQRLTRITPSSPAKPTETGAGSPKLIAAGAG